MLKNVQRDCLQPGTRYIAFNENGNSETTCIAFTIGRETWSYDTSEQRYAAQPLELLKTILSSSTIIFKASTLSTAAAYFQDLKECTNNGSFTNFPVGSEDLHAQLKQLNARRDAILNLFQELTVCIDTELDRMLDSVPRHGSCDEKKKAMRQVIACLSGAVGRYEALPRLVPFNVPEARGDNPNRRGARFTNWALRQKTLANHITTSAEEIRPLHMARFRWNSEVPDADQRRLSMDLVGAFQGCPVVMEVKMMGDSWTFQAIPQLLRYGAMVTPSQQRNRFIGLRGITSTEKLWLALATESRQMPGYNEDYDCAIKWLEQDVVKKELKKYFDGIFVLRYDCDEEGERWTLDKDMSKQITFG